MDADGGNQVRYTNNSGLDGAPSWSPNGETIAFHTSRSGHLEIYLIDANGTNLRRRTLDGDVESQPRWAPSGIEMTFVTSLGPNDEVCVGGLSGGAFNISNNSARDFRPAWR
jgi:Tol biopolymer transport system component